MEEKVGVDCILYTAKEAAAATEERLNVIFTKSLENIATYIKCAIEKGEYSCVCPYPFCEDVIKAMKGLGYRVIPVQRYTEPEVMISWKNVSAVE